MQNYVKISENSVKNLEILLNISRVFCKLVDLGSLMHYLSTIKHSETGHPLYHSIGVTFDPNSNKFRSQEDSSNSTD